MLGAIQQGLVASAHDLSEGGLAVALAESCISGNIGAQVSLETALRPDVALFSESQSRILLSASEEKAAQLEQYLKDSEVPVTKIGRVAGKTLEIDINRASAVNKSVEGLKQTWEEVIPCLMK